MDEKISLAAVDQYSDAYANKMASIFFATKERITGPQILSLCDIKQINLFVLRELMHAWKIESQKLKSPFFNYEAEEVVKSLANFQNTLSNHISISKSDFLPLLKKAVSKTIFVVLDPYDFYSDTLDHQVQVADLKGDLKYLKINKAPLERLVQKLEERKLNTLAGNEAFALLDSILEEVNFTPEDIEAYLEQFSRIVPLSLEKLYEHKAVNKPKTETPVPPPPSAPPPLIQERKPVVATPVADRKPVVNNFQKIGQIKDTLTINQKFMFTKILFNGDFEIFSQAIDRLDNLDNLNQALQYVETNYSEWDKDSEEYIEFREMLEKRFA